MERLTVRGQKGHAYFDEDGLLIRGANGAFHLKKDMTAHFIHQRFVALDNVIDRLAAYEDTGLTPEEVMKLAQAKKDAINEAQSRTEKNEPLTLDELRKMDGKLVWIERIGERTPYDSAVAFVRTGYSLCRTADGCNAFFELYGTSWLAYRIRPEAEAAPSTWEGADDETDPV